MADRARHRVHGGTDREATFKDHTKERLGLWSLCLQVSQLSGERERAQGYYKKITAYCCPCFCCHILER
jgi:hypothetical protein